MKQTLLFIALRINSLGSEMKLELCVDVWQRERIESVKRHKVSNPQTNEKIHNINVKLLQNNSCAILENSSAVLSERG